MQVYYRQKPKRSKIFTSKSSTGNLQQDIGYSNVFRLEDSIFCIFKEAFFTEKIRGNLSDLPMFAIGGKPAYVINEAQEEQV